MALSILSTFQVEARRAGSDGSMSVSGSAGPGSIPGGVVTFHLKIFNLGARRGGDVHFLIARLYITGSMSVSGSAGPGFDPRRGSNFSLENFQPRG